MYNIHIDSKKHNKNEKNATFCYICDKEYDTRRKYTKHRFNVHKKNGIKVKVKEYKKNINQNNIDNNINAEVIDKPNIILETSKKLLTKSSSIIRYITEHYPNSSNITKIKTEQFEDKLNTTFIINQSN